ncbi:MAG TPA: DUF4347 domain-containing protein, partial [Paraburkholderia sp.]|nr:DUF4347 domain-containing protein [Paraburkholderia sp.]
MKFAAALIDALRRRRAHGAAAAPRAAMPAALPAPLMLALEPRIVYDASAAAIGAGAGAAGHAGPAAQQHHGAEAHPADTSVAQPGSGHGADTPAAAPAAQRADTAQPTQRQTTQVNPQVTPQVTPQDMQTAAAPEKQVVFIDPSVANYQQLVAGLPAGTDYVLLSSSSDGLAQIAQYLQQHPGVDAIHLVSHGMNGAIQVGDVWLTQSDIAAYSGELAQIGAAMKTGGDFLIYGCDVAENSSGQALVQQIASISHLNVAASTDATGAAALGGDWTLEYDVGAVHTQTIFSAASEQQYDALLGVTVETYDSAADLAFDSTGTSFTLDGITYTTDAAAEFQVQTTASNPSNPPALSSGTGDGVLFGNVSGNAPMTSLTLTLQNGDAMAVQSFDLDIYFPSTVNVEALDASGNVIGSVTLQSHDASDSSFHVDLSGNAAFAGAKSLRIRETDGAFLLPILDNFSYVDLSSPPALTASGGSTSFVSGDHAGGPAVVIDSGITLVDGDATTARQAVVAITGNFHSGEDVLGFANTSTALYGDIVGTYSSGTGVLTLTSASGTATVAQWQNALEHVTYSDSLALPNTATRTISFTLTSDAYLSPSNTVQKTVTVTAAEQSPTLTSSGTTSAYGSGAAATTIDTHITVTDTDNTTQASGSVRVSAGFNSGDTLSFNNSNPAIFGNIIGAYDGNGTLTLTSAGATASDAQWAAALSAVTFSSTSNVYGNRIISFQTSDGTKTSTAVTDTITVTNPVQLVASGGSTAFQAADNGTSVPVAIDPGMTAGDTAVTTAKSATVSITGNFQSGEDVLAFTNTSSSTFGDIAATYSASTGLLTLTSGSGTATLAQWQAALRAVTYTDTLVTPNSATRTISFKLVDKNNNTSNTITRTVTVTDTDQTPLLTTSGTTTGYVTGHPATAIDGSVAISDLDNTTQSSGTVSITGGLQGGDTLSFINTNSALFGNIGASYNSATGVLTLTSAGGVATNAQWANALSAVTFSSSSVVGGNRTISFAVNDGTKTSVAGTDTVNVVAPPVVTTDSGSAAFVAGDNTAGTPVAIDSGLTVTDTSSPTLQSATVSITGNFHSGEDLLGFANDGTTMGNIAASYDVGTGVLTLTSVGGTATLAQWQSALRAVTYFDSAVTPNNATRTLSFTVVDGAGTSSSTATRTVTVTDTDQTPIVGSSGTTTDYVGGHPATTIDGGITVSDLDNATQTSGTVSITGGLHSGDTLTFINNNSTLFGDIVASYNTSTGLLTLTAGTATNAQWANALSAVTFSSSSVVGGNRTISFAVNDGTKTSVAATDTVRVTAPPVVTTDGGSAAFVAGDNTASTPVAIDSGLTLTDGASATLQSATVSVTGNFHSGEDALGFTNDGATMGNISATYDASTGVLTLTSAGGTATLAQWQSALRSVTYTDTAVTPANPTRTIGFSVVDGAGNASGTATRTVTVTDTDQTPIVTPTSGATRYVGGTSAVAVDSGVTVSDRDNANLISGIVTISGGYQAGDTLSATSVGGISVFYDPTTHSLLLSGVSSVANWQSVLESVTFSSTSFTAGSRTIEFQISDGSRISTAPSKTISVLGPPQITTDSGSAAFVAGDNTASTPVAIDSGLTLTDGAATTLQSATVSITGNFHAGEDVLQFVNDGATMGNIVASYDAATGVLTLNSSGATATLAQWQAALAAVTYTDTAITPSNPTRTISFGAVDGAGFLSNTAVRTVTVTDTDQTPIVTGTGGTSYVGGTAAVPIDSGISVSDLDNATLASGTVSISANFHSGDTLAFTNTNTALFGNIVATYDAGTGVLTLTSSGATASDAQWANALAAVTFSAGSSAVPGSRTISFAINDGTKTSAAATDIVNVLGPPQITTDAGSASFVAGDNTASTPVAIDAGLTLTDGASATMASATVSITGNFHAGEDLLQFVNDGATMGNIAATYDAANGVLTLSSAGASATLAQWQAALEAVTYTDTAITPNTATRTISFNAVDGVGVISNTATRTVTVTDTDQTPVVATSGSTLTYAGGAPASVIDSGITVSDRDNATLASATVSIGSGFANGDTLGFANTNSAQFGNISASYDASTGVLTLTSAGATATEAQWSAALSAVTFASSSTAFGNRTIAFAVSDGSKTSVVASDTVQLAAPPQLTAGAGSADFIEGDNVASTPVTVGGGLSVTDGASGTLASATVAISGGFHAGEDVLSFSNDGATMGNISASYDASTGVLTLSSAGGTATLAQWQSALNAVTYTDTAISPDTTTRTVSFAVVDGAGNLSNTATRDVNVHATDQSTLITPPDGGTYKDGSTPTVIGNGITITDADNPTQSSATVTIGTGFHFGDRLAFINTNAAAFGNIQASYDADSGVLTLTSAGATATNAQWSRALSEITFATSSSSVGPRTVLFVVSDGAKTS